MLVHGLFKLLSSHFFSKIAIKTQQLRSKITNPATRFTRFMCFNCQFISLYTCQSYMKIWQIFCSLFLFLFVGIHIQTLFFYIFNLHFIFSSFLCLVCIFLLRFVLFSLVFFPFPFSFCPVYVFLGYMTWFCSGNTTYCSGDTRYSSGVITEGAGVKTYASGDTTYMVQVLQNMV